MNTKILRNILLSLGLILTLTSCGDSTQNNVTEVETTKVAKENLDKVLLNVEGMTCEGCEQAIQNNLSKLSGVVSVIASHVDKTTAIDFDKTKITAAELEKAIVETGYKIMTAAQSEAPKVAPKAAMKCGEGKCGASMKCGNAE